MSDARARWDAPFGRPTLGVGRGRKRGREWGSSHSPPPLSGDLVRSRWLGSPPFSPPPQGGGSYGQYIGYIRLELMPLLDVVGKQQKGKGRWEGCVAKHNKARDDGDNCI